MNRTKSASVFRTGVAVIAAFVVAALVAPGTVYATPVTINGCTFDVTGPGGANYKLAGNCNATAQISLPAGITLNGQGFQINAPTTWNWSQGDEPAVIDFLTGADVGDKTTVRNLQIKATSTDNIPEFPGLSGLLFDGGSVEVEKTTITMPDENSIAINFDIEGTGPGHPEVNLLKNTLRAGIGIEVASYGDLTIASNSIAAGKTAIQTYKGYAFTSHGPATIRKNTLTATLRTAEFAIDFGEAWADVLITQNSMSGFGTAIFASVLFDLGIGSFEVTKNTIEADARGFYMRTPGFLHTCINVPSVIVTDNTFTSSSGGGTGVELDGTQPDFECDEPGHNAIDFVEVDNNTVTGWTTAIIVTNVDVAEI
jgi:hypothetical protein